MISVRHFVTSLFVGRTLAAGALVVSALAIPAVALAQAPETSSPHVVRTTKFTINGDVEAHSAFYQKMFEMTEVNRFVDEGRLVEPFVGYRKDVKVGLLSYDDKETIAKTKHPVTVFFTPDLDGVIKRLQEAQQPHEVLSESEVYGSRVVITRDPSGNTIEVVERAGIPALGGAKLIVEDLKKAEQFFVELFGVSAGKRAETKRGGEAFMNFGGEMFVALFEPKEGLQAPKSKYPVVAIYTTEFDQVLARIKAMELTYHQRNDRVMFVDDPSGNVVEVVREPGNSVTSAYVVPRTPWGHPDLQGTYTNGSQTPFERPEALGDKAFYTEDEVAVLEKKSGEAYENAKTQPVKRAEAGKNVGAYNQLWLDPRTNVVGTRRTSLVMDPPNGRVPIRPEAIAERDYHQQRVADDYLHMSPWDRCITRGVPGGFFQSAYNNNYIIVQNENTVAIYFEMIHDVRLIPLDGRPPLPAHIEQWNGDSRGHWEGDTLVVTTANLSDKGWIATSGSQGRVKGIAQTKNTHVVERFTRTSDDTIDYLVTVTDPAIYTAPWTAQIPLYTEDDLVLFEYACQEGNWAVRNTLSGGRAQD